jgi:hypothetical protein
MKIKILILLVLLNGCTATKPLTLNTPSGKPDITIPKVSKKQVTDAFVSEMLSQGFNIKTSSDYNIVFVKPMDSFAMSLLLGSEYDITPEHRVSANIVESSAGVRIVLTNQGITNPGSAFERVTDLSTGNSGNSWQQLLVSFSGLFRGRIGCDIDEQGTIIKVFDGSPSQLVGLKVGDKIISLDGNPFKDRSQAISQAFGDPDTNVEIIVLRNAEKLIFNITRKIY